MAKQITDKLPPPLNEPCPKPDEDIEVVCLKDERVRIDPMTSPPYKYICALLMTAPNGDQYVGTGFMIHVPNIDKFIVTTAGHNLYLSSGEYMDKVEVTFPGKAAQEVDSNSLYVCSEYKNLRNSDERYDYDYGLIILPGNNSDEGFGWSAIAFNDDIVGRTVTICGYPGEKKPWPQMWMSGGAVTGLATAKQIEYVVDTTRGQSGSPVYMWYKGYQTVVGIHIRSTDLHCPNAARVFTSDMIYNFLEFATSLKKYSLESVQFTDVFIRCDGGGVTKPESPGSGVINCQYGPPSDWETFYIFPTEVTPSLAQEETLIVTLQNCHWPKTYLRMDGNGITHFMSPGGGVVNCQSTQIPASGWESFIMKEDPKLQYYFQSVRFPHRYLRLDGNGVTKWMALGGGVVNCQYYNSDGDVTSWEKFSLK